MPRNTQGQAAAPAPIPTASRSHKSNSTPPSTGNTSPTGASVAAAQAKRQRASSLTASITQGQLRRRKRDMLRECWRRILRLKDADGRVKLGLFLSLAGALWLLVLSTAPPPEKIIPPATTPTTITPLTTPIIPPEILSKLSATAALAASGIDYSKTAPPISTPTVLQTFPHDPDAFTQGLLIHNGQMWESTGMYGESEVREVNVETGAVLARWSLAAQHFGEGLCMWQDQLLQLTWREHVGFVYNSTSFTGGPLKEFRVNTEGWGITTTGDADDSSIIISDGSATLQFIKPQVGCKHIHTYRHFSGIIPLEVCNLFLFR